MNEEQILQYLESDDRLNQQWFIWQGTKSNSIQDFYLAEIRDDLDDRILALAIHNDIYYDEAEKLIDDDDYFVLTDEEADEKAEEWAWELAEMTPNLRYQIIYVHTLTKKNMLEII